MKTIASVERKQLSIAALPLQVKSIVICQQ